MENDIFKSESLEIILVRQGDNFKHVILERQGLGEPTYLCAVILDESRE